MPDYSFTILDNYNKTSQSIGQTYPMDRGQTLLKNLLLQDIITYSKCGGKAVCSRCRVKVILGEKFCNKPITEERILLGEEKITQGWRLACQLYCLKEISIYIPSKEEINVI